ncbi:RICIN domain-containing protein [Krasilnikovia cinnamomea]|uniref:RICIN domain-containing protein n=1 Tax=Krasilnikovia cinnamomea TaxID=349313 RepID=UPI00102AEC93|nr:RICIN domain-containing protein [Krasilnikovia cinnamomea]
MSEIRKSPQSSTRRRKRVAIAGLSAVVVAGLLAGTTLAHAVEGEPAADGKYGFVAHVQIGEPGAGGRACTGALIAPQWVATAAACFLEPGQTTLPFGAPGKPTTVTVGRADLTTTAGQAVRVAELVSRPGRDVALARLVSPVTSVQPVAIATTAPSTADVLTVAGYGRTKTDWVPNRLHTAAYAVTAVAGDTVDIAPQTPADSGICKGDAGGPALREAAGKVELVAMHHSSTQSGCLGSTETRQGAVETRVDDLNDWMTTYIRTGSIGVRNGVSGKCLETDNNAGNNGAQIQQWTCGDQLAAKWDLEFVGKNGSDPIYRLRHRAHPNMCVEIPDGSTLNGAVAQLWQCGDQPAAQWTWRHLGAGKYNLINVKSGKCLEVDNGTSANGAKAQQWGCGGQAAATWHRDETVTVRNGVSGKCLETDNNAGNNGAQIQQWTCGGQPAANWNLEFVGTSGNDPIYRLRHRAHPNMCVEIPDGSTLNGAVAQLWQCGNQPTAQWTWRHLGAGKYNLINVLTGKCLEMNNATSANGAKAQQWGCGGQAAATWYKF